MKCERAWNLRINSLSRVCLCAIRCRHKQILFVVWCTKSSILSYLLLQHISSLHIPNRFGRSLPTRNKHKFYCGGSNVKPDAKNTLILFFFCRLYGCRAGTATTLYDIQEVYICIWDLVLVLFPRVQIMLVSTCRRMERKHKKKRPKRMLSG